MRLDMDCVRSILLCVEENTGLHQHCCFVDTSRPEIDRFLGNELTIPSYQGALQEKYDNEKLLYHARYCIDADLLRRPDSTYIGNSIVIADLTPKGHEFLANVRQESIWNNTKQIAGKIGATSLSTLIQIATNVVTGLVNSHFGIT